MLGLPGTMNRGAGRSGRLADALRWLRAIRWSCWGLCVLVMLFWAFLALLDRRGEPDRVQERARAYNAERSRR